MTVASGGSRKDKVSKAKNRMTLSTPFNTSVPLFTPPSNTDNSDPKGEKTDQETQGGAMYFVVHLTIFKCAQP